MRNGYPRSRYTGSHMKAAQPSRFQWSDAPDAAMSLGLLFAVVIWMVVVFIG